MSKLYRIENLMLNKMIDIKTDNILDVIKSIKENPDLNKSIYKLIEDNNYITYDVSSIADEIINTNLFKRGRPKINPLMTPTEYKKWHYENVIKTNPEKMEKRRQYAREYAIKNRERILNNKKNKKAINIICSCGSEILKSSYKDHLQSTYHKYHTNL